MQGDHLDALLRALDTDPERAGVQYRQLHQRLARFFRLNSGSDPEALADEAMDRLARRIATSQADDIGSPQAFALGIGRHLLQEDARTRRREEEAAQEWATLTLAQDGHREDLLRALDQCMAAMREDQRRLLRSYYQWTGGRKIEHHRQVAKKLGVTLNAMRNRLMRARAELDKCIHKRCSDVFDRTDTKS